VRHHGTDGWRNRRLGIPLTFGWVGFAGGEIEDFCVEGIQVVIDGVVNFGALVGKIERPGSAIGTRVVKDEEKPLAGGGAAEKN